MGTDHHGVGVRGRHEPGAQMEGAAALVHRHFDVCVRQPVVRVGVVRAGAVQRLGRPNNVLRQPCADHATSWDA